MTDVPNGNQNGNQKPSRFNGAFREWAKILLPALALLALGVGGYYEVKQRVALVEVANTSSNVRVTEDREALKTALDRINNKLDSLTESVSRKAERK